MNLAAKYRPSKLDDVVEQSVVIEILKSIFSNEPITVRNVLLTGPAGTGKAQPLYSKVLTPEGFISMEEVKVGTSVVTGNGNVGKVVGVYPQGIRPIYRLRVDDGNHIDVSDEHLNIVTLRRRSDPEIVERKILTTIQLLEVLQEGKNRVYVDTPCVKHTKESSQTALELMIHKKEVTVDEETGCMTYKTDDKKASSAFSYLVKSLGMVDVKTVHCISENHYEIVHSVLPNRPREILELNYLQDDECQCIMIDHSDHSYISDGFIPTHNTTTARILADIANEGVGEPIEIDAASHSGVDAMREIVQQAKSFPMIGKYKVFIIDEVHSISSAGWQVLLKVLEENPAKSIFILCTTNPEKIPATILSRVQTFQLSKISLEGIVGRLRHIVEEEKKEGRDLTFTEDALNYIGKLAGGGMRDAITLLDKALAFSNDITLENLNDALNLPNYDKYFELLNFIAKKNNQGIAGVIDEVYNSGINFIKWFEGFHSFVCNIVKYIYLQDINSTMIPGYYQEKIQGYGTSHSALCLRLAKNLLNLNRDLRTTQYLQETAITYLCT